MNKLPVMQVFTMPELNVIAQDVCFIKEYEPNETICLRSEPARYFYLLMNGEVTITHYVPPEPEPEPSRRRKRGKKRGERMPIKSALKRGAQSTAGGGGVGTGAASETASLRPPRSVRVRAPGDSDTQGDGSGEGPAVAANGLVPKVRGASTQVVGGGVTHFFIMCAGPPKQKLVLRAIGATHPFFNEHCLVCNQPVQYDVEATGTATVRLLVLSPAALTEFFMSTKVSAPARPLTQRCN